MFLTGEAMVADDQGASFGPEMAALAKSFKTRFSIWQEDEDIPLVYTVPGKALAPAITHPEGIRGKSTAVTLDEWLEIGGVLKAVAE